MKDLTKLINETMNALTNIPHGLTIEEAEYSILRVFASWPGEAKLERTLEPRKTTDLDKHPLAALDLETFLSVGKELNREWIRMDVERRMVVTRKHAREEQESESRSQKRARLGPRLEAQSAFPGTDSN